jgi:hypothetical protein
MNYFIINHEYTFIYMFTYVLLSLLTIIFLNYTYKRRKNIKSCCKLSYISTKLCFQVCKVLISRWLLGLSTEKKNGYTIVSYVLDGHLHKFAIKRKKGPSKILQISDESSEDITDTLIPHFNHIHHSHEATLTPAFWNKNKLFFVFSDGDETVYEKDDIISL